MSLNAVRQYSKAARIRIPLVAVFALGCALGTAKDAAAQSVKPPATPVLITPPEGNTAFLLGHAVGTQGYVCLPTAAGASWTVNNARPEATLFTRLVGLDVQIITHFLSPDNSPNKDAPDPLPFGSATWQSSFDSSKVWAAVLHGNMIPAGPDQPSCPNAGAIACLLLQSIGSEQGPAGGRIMNQVTFVQRLNTKGGSAPAEGCSVAGDVGKQALVPYSADYYFYRESR
jgi:uncharacterized protein DUF3455